MCSAERWKPLDLRRRGELGPYDGELIVLHLIPNLCLNLQAGLLRPLWRFSALLRFLFGTLLPCSFQAPLSAFGICVGLDSVY